MSATIDRQSAVPYYEQLLDILRDRISRGTIGEGERLPSEHELCRAFGLSRATVRQTISRLESEGFARRVARRGAFATMPRASQSWIVQDETGFLEAQLRHGSNGVETEVVRAGFVTPPQHVADALQVGPSARVFGIERIRSIDGSVAMFSTNWFPEHVGSVVATEPDVLSGVGSVNAALRRAGYATAGARRVLSATLPTPEVAEHLGIRPEHPAMRIRSLSWDGSDVRFDYYETWVLTDVVPLEVVVAADADVGASSRRS